MYIILDGLMAIHQGQGLDISNLTMAPVLLMFPGSKKCMGQNWVPQ